MIGGGCSGMYRDPTPCEKCGKWRLVPGTTYIGEFCKCDRSQPKCC